MFADQISEMRSNTEFWYYRPVMATRQTTGKTAPSPTVTEKKDSFMFEKLVPGLTAVAVSDRKDVIQSLSNVIQRQRKEGWLQALLVELNALCEKGKVKEGYMQTPQAQDCRQELIDSLDQDAPDQGKFEAMKKIFLRAAQSEEKDWESPRPGQMMRIARLLSADELTILGVAYKLRKSEPESQRANWAFDAKHWMLWIAEESNGLITEGLVSYYENALIEKKLIGDREHTDRSGVKFRGQCRLAPLGIELCAFLAGD